MEQDEIVAVWGPYFHRGRWHLITAGRTGRRANLYYSDEAEARRAAKTVREKALGVPLKSVEAALAQYERFRREKGNKSVKETSRRLTAFFVDSHLSVQSLSEDRCLAYYRRWTHLRTDTHRNYLAEAKTFLRWCVKQRWIRVSPLEHVEGIGRRSHGKQQLRIDEARLWLAKAIEINDEGSTVAVMALLLGLRVSEIITRVVRDVDDGGRLLWIPDAKTEAGKRTIQIPDILQPLIAARALGRASGDYLFPARTGERYTTGHRSKRWVLEKVKEICRLAGVPEVSTHGMRGLHATLAIDGGVTGHVVAQALGHESVTTTMESYAKPESLERARVKRATDRLSGKL